MNNNNLKINITQSNKSVPILPEFFLPAFTVLTGPNGSGKSHLFETLYTKSSISFDEKPMQNIKYIAFNQLSPSIDMDCNPTLMLQRANELWNIFSEIKNRYKLNNPSSNKQEETTPEKNPIFHGIVDPQLRERIAAISRKTKIPIGLINEHTVYDYILTFGETGNELFDGQFARIFKSYQIKKLDNRLNKIYIEDGIEAEYLNDDEFINKNGEPPWVFVDRLLDRLQLPYSVTNPENSKRESTFRFELIHKEQGFKISSNDLSTGEKTIMSLALAIYNTTNNFSKIDMLILDEPDAPLHPSMSKLMLDILKNDICIKYNIPVIISTHSPATIACAPAKSLYKISKENKVPKACSLEDSINLLTYGIPNFRLSIDERRQVFVESKYDVSYYEKLFDILSKEYIFPTFPQFLRPHNRHDSSNCTDVKEIVTALRSLGNDLVYGLIDHDTDNKNSDQIVVLGNENRYAIENYIFEPHIFALYMIKKTFLKPSELDAQFKSYIEICNNLSEAVLQSLVENISTKLGFTGSRRNSHLVNNYILTIPDEYFLMQGHELEKKHRTTWPKLESIIRSNDDSLLKLDIINVAINDFPSLVSKDLIWTFDQFK